MSITNEMLVVGAVDVGYPGSSAKPTCEATDLSRKSVVEHPGAENDATLLLSEFLASLSKRLPAIGLIWG